MDKVLNPLQVKDDIAFYDKIPTIYLCSPEGSSQPDVSSKYKCECLVVQQDMSFRSKTLFVEHASCVAACQSSEALCTEDQYPKCACSQDVRPDAVQLSVQNAARL